MTPFQKLRIAVAKSKLSRQLYDPHQTRTLSISLQSSDGLTATDSISYTGPMSAEVLEQIEYAIETLDFKISASQSALQSLAVEQGVPPPSP